MVRKLIVRNPENLSPERCSSREFAGCPLYATAPRPGEAEDRCPYLDESLVQYCAAAPVPKFIPFSEAVLSRCGSASYRYCDLFVTMAHPTEAGVPEVRGIAVPQWLRYAPNHMWLDASEDGVYHIGVDALFARSLGKVDRIIYLTSRGVHHPAVVLSSGSKDFHMVFPNRMLITGPNVYLRANPAKLVSDPYRLGWLFECRAVPEPQTGEHPAAGLREGGEEATRWMQTEHDRVGAFIHNCAGTSSGNDTVVNDGGEIAPGFVEYLDREQAARLHHAFFSPAWMR